MYIGSENQISTNQEDAYMPKAMIGYQLYSAREEMTADFRGTLEKVKALGYDCVEFAGLFGKEPKEIRAMLNEIGLKAISAHVPFDAICADMDGTIAAYKEIGCDYITVPFLGDQDRPGAAGFAGVISALRQFGEKCNNAGITLLYHNHDFEFVSVSGMYGLDFLYEAVPADFLQTELDTCWVRYAGEDPAAYIRKYAGRCPIVHLKDYVGVKGGAQPYALINADGTDDGKNENVAFQFMPVGHGCQDVKAIIEAGLESGAHTFIVEQDQWYDRHPLDAAKMSIETVKNILK